MLIDYLYVDWGKPVCFNFQTTPDSGCQKRPFCFLGFEHNMPEINPANCPRKLKASLLGEQGGFINKFQVKITISLTS
jgi:hypothetical protein